MLIYLLYLWLGATIALLSWSLIGLRQRTKTPTVKHARKQSEMEHGFGFSHDEWMDAIAILREKPSKHIELDAVERTMTEWKLKPEYRSLGSKVYSNIRPKKAHTLLTEDETLDILRDVMR